MYVASIVISANWQSRMCKFCVVFFSSPLLSCCVLIWIGEDVFVDLAVNLQFHMAIVGFCSQFTQLVSVMVNISELCTKVVLRYLPYGATRGRDLVPIMELLCVESSPMKHACSHKSVGMAALLISNLARNSDRLRSNVACVVRFAISTGVCTIQEVILIVSLDQSAYDDSFF